MTTRSVREVAEDHLAAVESGDPAAMAADYSADAVLIRGADVFEGQRAIAAYFATVPSRLAGARVVFDSLEIDDETATFTWHLEGAPGDAAGTDTCRIVDGAIVHQTVRLAADDF